LPPFSHLRSDYPLNLTLLEHVRVCALTWFYIAGLTSPRTILISPIRHNDPVPVRFYSRSCANSRSFACVPLAGKSTFGLTPARASVREFRLHIDEQLTPPVEHRCANPRGNTQLNILGLRASLLFCKSMPCVVVGFRFQVRNGTEGVHFGSVAPCRVVRGHRSKSSQTRRNTLCLKAEE
jgi:hypothetical protein